MDLKVTIKNLGKLTDADIRINKFTVFAGLNNTGKSFASKALYSRLSGSLGDINFLGRLERHAYWLRESIDSLKNEGFEDDTNMSLLLQHLDKFHEVIAEIKNVGARSKIPAFKDRLTTIFNTCESIRDVCADMVDNIEIHDSVYGEYEEGDIGEEEREFDFENFQGCSYFFESMTEDEIRDTFTADIEKMFEYNFLYNFQAKKLSELANDKGKGISVKIDAESLMLKQEGYIKDYLNDENYSGLGVLDTFIANKTLFIGSPLFWQLKNPLESADDKKHSSEFERRLSGIPKYFNDMVRTLRDEYIGDPISSKVLDRLTGEHGINGKVSVASTGEMIYAENNGVTVPLGRAATGIANMGVLALLIEKNIPDKNTFIFMDEPEAHMHPKWQVEMADALFKLAKAGVNIVIATHSGEILKWLEVHVKENPDAKDMIALNHFQKDGNVESNGRDFDERLNTIQEELTDPYYRLFYRGI